MRRKWLLVVQVAVIFVVATALYFRGDQISGQLRQVAQLAKPPADSTKPPPAPTQSDVPSNEAPASATAPETSTAPDAASDSINSTDSTESGGSAENSQPGVLLANVTALYVDSILNNSLADLPTVGCPDLSASSTRYDSLKAANAPKDGQPAIAYFFAIDLRDTLELLPQLLGSVVETIRFLGPARCALSIIEGNSEDGTYEVLDSLRPALDALTTTYYLRSSDINPKEGDRIAKLAQLRNMALQPLKDESSKYSANTTILFLNDIAACTEDILELVLQRQILGADMVCGMDYAYVGKDPTFYDVWIARGLQGDTFFEIPADGNWNSAWNLFWNDDRARSRLHAHQPFQVFSCWNGAAVFSARPVVEDKIEFRTVREGECIQGEPQLFCKDLWYAGYGKIAVVPSISFEYTVDRGQQIKALKGFTSQWTTPEVDENNKFEWQLEPPAKVKCIPNDYAKQEFRPWNETLGA